MPQVTVVQVDFSSNKVLELYPMDSRFIPDAPQGTYYLVPGVDFPASTVVAKGQEWDGTRSPTATTFSDPAPVDPKTLPQSVDEAWALVAQKKAELAEVEAQLARILGVG